MNDQKSLEETLREHTRQVIQQKKTEFGFSSLLGQKTTTEKINNSNDDETTQPFDFLFHPTSHVFLGVWQRTKYISGAWPQCLSGENRSRVSLGNYDAPHSVVWRFVNANSRSKATSSVPRTAYLEMVDHPSSSSSSSSFTTPSNDPAPSSSANKATNPSAKYVSADLNLVSDQNYAAMFHLERVPSYRHGKLDVALTLTLISRNQHDLVLCSTGEGDVVFVTRDRLDTKDVSTGEYTYNISWEATPDSDATLMCERSGEQGEGGEGGVPLEKYMEDFSYRMLSSK